MSKPGLTNEQKAALKQIEMLAKAHFSSGFIVITSHHEAPEVHVSFIGRNEAANSLKQLSSTIDSIL